MGRYLFTADFEINASPKMLYPYLSTASGLSQWMADDVTIDEDKVFNFIWDDEDHIATIVSHRTNHYVKFQFVSLNGSEGNNGEDDDPAFFELRLELNELTQTVFLKITDYSDMDDDEELHDMWQSLIDNLKEMVGG